MTYKLGLCVARSAGEYVASVTVVSEVTNWAYTCRRTVYTDKFNFILFSVLWSCNPEQQVHM